MGAGPEDGRRGSEPAARVGQVERAHQSDGGRLADVGVLRARGLGDAVPGARPDGVLRGSLLRVLRGSLLRVLRGSRVGVYGVVGGVVGRDHGRGGDLRGEQGGLARVA